MNFGSLFAGIGGLRARSLADVIDPRRKWKRGSIYGTYLGERSVFAREHAE